jgi:hypothetical protein
MSETPTHDLFGASPSMHPSHPYLDHSGIRPLGPNDDSLLLPPVPRPGRSDTSSVVNSINVLHPDPSPSSVGVRP